jgi:2-polyprenyl-6-methoxyphenol hydroxylase-like FAD-dependent oxidoreductase
METTAMVGACNCMIFELIRSLVRKCLIQDEEKSSLTVLPIRTTGAVRHFTPEQGAEPRSLDPLLFLGLHPKTSNFLWYSIQDVYQETNGKQSFDALVFISWLVKDEEKDAIPPTKQLQIANMKERAQGFFGPLKRLVDEIPDDLEPVISLNLADFPNLDWESQANVTLAGDSAHAMTMFRGEGANHGILDAALLIDQLVKVKIGEIGQHEAIEVYEKEMKVRGRAAVLKSRQAALDGHCWESINDDSPLIGGRYDKQILCTPRRQCQCGHLHIFPHCLPPPEQTSLPFSLSILYDWVKADFSISDRWPPATT